MFSKAKLQKKERKTKYFSLFFHILRLSFSHRALAVCGRNIFKELMTRRFITQPGHSPDSTPSCFFKNESSMGTAFSCHWRCLCKNLYDIILMQRVFEGHVEYGMLTKYNGKVHSTVFYLVWKNCAKSPNNTELDFYGLILATGRTLWPYWRSSQPALAPYSELKLRT